MMFLQFGGGGTPQTSLDHTWRQSSAAASPRAKNLFKTCLGTPQTSLDHTWLDINIIFPEIEKIHFRLQTWIDEDELE